MVPACARSIKSWSGDGEKGVRLVQLHAFQCVNFAVIVEKAGDVRQRHHHITAGTGGKRGFDTPLDLAEREQLSPAPLAMFA